MKNNIKPILAWLALVLLLDLEQVARLGAIQPRSLHDPVRRRGFPFERPQGCEHLGLTVGASNRRPVTIGRCYPFEIHREWPIHRRGWIRNCRFRGWRRRIDESNPAAVEREAFLQRQPLHASPEWRSARGSRLW